ncbi:MAG: sugar ABC transporter permease [Ruminiclostridium sp.]|nr:sugar ABC transporter permease [Ruminiclostridium sp.]
MAVLPVLNKSRNVALNRTRLYIKYKYLFILMIPGICALLLFSYYPMYGVILAFKEYKLGDGIFGSQWADMYGLKHFIRVFQLEGVRRAVANSFIISMYSLAVGFPAVILFALFLNEIKREGLKRRIQTISYLPNFLSWVAVSSLVIDVLSPSHGILNAILNFFTGQNIYFLTRPEYFRTIIVFSGLWKGIGWGSIIYLAMIANANIELYDAAIVDGAGRIRQAIHVTIPAMFPIISIGLIMSLSGILNGGDFEQIFNLVNSQTLPVGDVMSIYIFRVGLGSYEYSFGTALGLVNTTVGILLLAIANKVAKRVSEYTLW